MENLKRKVKKLKSEYKKGMKVEQEHSDITHGSKKTTGKLVLDHLTDIPDYYTRLTKMENKAKKVKTPKKWIQKAIKSPGALRKSLGAKKGSKIPAKKLAKATKSKSPLLRKRANLAKTLSELRKR